MTQTLSQEEKEDLKDFAFTPRNLDGRDLIKALLVFFIVFCLFAPKIYLSSQVYYLSKDIAKMSNHLELLQEENKNLKQELEDFKFQQLLRMES